MRIKCLAQGHYCPCQQIWTGHLTIESPWSYPLSHNSFSSDMKIFCVSADFRFFSDPRHFSAFSAFSAFFRVFLFLLAQNCFSTFLYFNTCSFLYLCIFDHCMQRAMNRLSSTPLAVHKSMRVQSTEFDGSEQQCTTQPSGKMVNAFAAHSGLFRGTTP